MVKKIVCNIEIFSTEMQVFICKDGEIIPKKIPAKGAEYVLVGLCYDNHIYDLEVKGEPIFLESFIESIKTEEATLHSNNQKINIKVIE